MSDQQIVAALLATAPAKPDTASPEAASPEAASPEAANPDGAAGNPDDSSDADGNGDADLDSGDDGDDDDPYDSDEDPDRGPRSDGVDGLYDDEDPDSGTDPDNGIDEGPDGEGGDDNGPDGGPDQGRDDPGPAGGGAAAESAGEHCPRDEAPAGAGGHDDPPADDPPADGGLGDSLGPSAGDDPGDDRPGGHPNDDDPADSDIADSGQADSDPAADGPDGADPDGAGSRQRRLGRRGGLRLWAGLLTLIGGDERPGELLGWGPVHAELACDLAMTLPSWWCVLTGRDGTPQAVVPIRRRPPPTPASAPGTPAVSHRRVGECWFSVDPDTLRLLNGPDRAGPVAAGWSPVLAEVTASLATAQPGPPNGDPAARLPSAALRRWVHIRDRRCTFPGCRAPAHRTDVDHLVEHARGGATVDTGLAPACRHDHMLRHKGGWSVAQATPGQVVWTSPLGLSYQRLPPLELHDLPNPRSGALREDAVDLELELARDQDPSPWRNPPSCLEQDPEPEPPAPPPGQQATADEEIPF